MDLRREGEEGEGEGDEKTVGGGTLGTQRTLAGDVGVGAGGGKKMELEEEKERV